MRIACLSVHSSPLGAAGSRDTGGMSTYLRELSSALGKRGVKIDLFTRCAASSGERIVELGPNARLIFLPVGPEKVEKIDLYDHLPAFAERLERFQAAGRLRYDLIFSHYWLSGWAGRILARRWQVPHLIMFHTLGAAKNALCPGENEPRLRLEAEKILSAECSGVIVPSRREKELLMQYCGAGPERIRVVPCGVNLQLFQPREPAGLEKPDGAAGGGRVILYVGRIEPVKGLELLIQAAGELRDQVDFQLLIIGGNSYSSPAVEAYQRLAAQLGIASRITFLGLVEHQELPRYYSAAAVTALPSYYESFGMIALESLACGTPVVSTAVGDLKLIIRQDQTGRVIEGRSPRQMAAAIESFLSRAEKPVEACRRSVLGYGWPEIAAALLAACRELVN
ncbi:MAG: glycosyltransferase family 1 protein [Firmicutes bacterium]|nr:glycosyltransferase family 1 protein [Bacillota bacterium]